MARVQYEVLALEVDKLYPPYYTLKPGETPEDRCEFIAEFIQACGWTEEEYIDEYNHRATVKEQGN